MAVAYETPWADEHSMRFSARHIEAKGIGYPTGYTTLTAFFAPNPANAPIFPFIDIRGHVFDDGKLAANAGFGFRGLAGCRIFGANIYYDYRATGRQNYNQVGLGVESLTARWEMRANGYLPFGKKTSKTYDVEMSNYTYHSFNKHNLVLQQTISSKIQFAMMGVDAELGYHFLQSQNFDVFLGVGPYYYAFENKYAFGGEARLAVKLSRYLTLEGSTSYDNRFHQIAQGQISINIPFGPRARVRPTRGSCDECVLTQRMIQDVARQEIIVVDQKKHTIQHSKPAVNPTTNQPYYFIFVDNTSHSEGTFESPYPTLAEAQSIARPGDIIYIFPGDQTTTGLNSGITLQDHQRLWGSAATHHLATSQGVVIVPVQSSNEGPIISNTSGDVVTVANHNEISGVYIRHTAGHGIVGTDVTSLTVAGNLFEGTSNSVHLTNPKGTIEISDNRMNAGIAIDSTNIENANYVVKENNCRSDAHFFVASYTDCENVSTTLSDNFYHTLGESKILTYTNATLPTTPHQLTITNNKAYSDSGNSSSLLQLTLQNYANVVTIAQDNVFFNPLSDGCVIATTENSKLDLTFENNTSSSLSNINIALANSATMRGIISNNHLMHYTGTGISIAALSHATIPSLTINNNIIQGNQTNDGIYVETDDSAKIIGTISNNDIRTDLSGVNLVTKDHSEQSLTISDNTMIQLQNHGFNFTTNQSSKGFWNVNHNTFIAIPSGATLATSNDTSTTSLSFNHNLSTSAAPGVFQFTHSGGTFNLEPLSRNIGQITQTGAITNIAAMTSP